MSCGTACASRPLAKNARSANTPMRVATFVAPCQLRRGTAALSLASVAGCRTISVPEGDAGGGVGGGGGDGGDSRGAVLQMGARSSRGAGVADASLAGVDLTAPVPSAGSNLSEAALKAHAERHGGPACVDGTSALVTSLLCTTIAEDPVEEQH